MYALSVVVNWIWYAAAIYLLLFKLNIVAGLWRLLEAYVARF